MSQSKFEKSADIPGAHSENQEQPEIPERAADQIKPREYAQDEQRSIGAISEQRIKQMEQTAAAIGDLAVIEQVADMQEQVRDAAVTTQRKLEYLIHDGSDSDADKEGDSTEVDYQLAYSIDLVLSGSPSKYDMESVMEQIQRNPAAQRLLQTSVDGFKSSIEDGTMSEEAARPVLKRLHHQASLIFPKEYALLGLDSQELLRLALILNNRKVNVEAKSTPIIVESKPALSKSTWDQIESCLSGEMLGRELGSFSIDVKFDAKVRKGMQYRIDEIAAEFVQGKISLERAQAVLARAEQFADLGIEPAVIKAAIEAKSTAAADQEQIELPAVAEQLTAEVRAVSEFLETLPHDSEAKRLAYREIGHLLNEMDLTLDKAHDEYMPRLVFISWSHRDGEFVHAVKQRLEEKYDIRTWFDEQHLAGNAKQKVAPLEATREQVFRGKRDPVRGDFNIGIQKKGIPASSEVVFFLTKEVFKKFDQIKREIVAALDNAKKFPGSKELIPVFVGSPEDQKQFAQRLRDEGLEELLDQDKYPPIRYDRNKLGDDNALVDELITDIRLRHERNPSLGQSQVDKDRNASIQNVDAALQKYHGPELELLKRIIALREAISGMGGQIDQTPKDSPAREVLFGKLRQNMAELGQTVEAQIAKFIPDKTFFTFTQADESFARGVEKILAARGFNLVKAEALDTTPYGVFIVTRDSFSDQNFESMREPIQNFLDRAQKQPDRVDLVPVWIGNQDDYTYIIQQLNTMGLGKFADFLAVTSNTDNPSALSNVIEAGIRIREKEKLLGLVYRMDYNRLSPGDGDNSKKSKVSPPGRQPLDATRG